MSDKIKKFVVRRPEKPLPFVFNSAHSGRDYPEDFLRSSRLDSLTVRKSEDPFVEELFETVVDHGATLIHAMFPRAFVDTNREPFELDPLLFDEDLPSTANSKSARVLAGLGTIARVVTDSEEIYEQKPSLEEALGRINSFYRPYHAALQRLLNEALCQSGYVVLIDCHSMPSLSVLGDDRVKADIVLGDRFGTSCSGIVTDLAEQVLQDLGYVVARNQPYAGGYTTEHYGKPRIGVHALQIEINRSLYLDEDSLKKTDAFLNLKRDLDSLTEKMMGRLPELLVCPRLAAE